MNERDGRQPSLGLERVTTGQRVAAVEALLFASGGAEDVATLAAALDWSAAETAAALRELESQLSSTDRGLRLQRDGGAVQLVSAPDHALAIARLLGIERQTRLSSASLETLAIVAYRQPVTRSEIEAIRGVDSTGVLATLVARELIEPRGRRATPGSPVEYGTTSAFLQFFGLMSLDELPLPAE